MSESETHPPEKEADGNPHDQIAAARRERPTRPAEPQKIVVEAKSGSNPWWVLLGVLVGFSLPVLLCVVLLFTGSFGLASLGSAAAPAGSSGIVTTSSGTGPAVAVIRIEGAIVNGDDEDSLIEGTVSGVTMAQLRDAEADPDVRAILLRVDSPGGTVTGSAQIYEVVRDEITKPVVVSMSATAASGGYYVSAPADYIFARADTITGSIGVILTLFNAQELIDELGVDVISITSGPSKSLGSPWDEFTEEEREIFESIIEESYDDFVQVVVDGRNLREDAVRQLADGRIYTGRQALDLGLVDELGNLQDAIDKAADLGGISGEPNVIEYERLPSFGELLAGFQAQAGQTEAEQVINAVAEFAQPVLEYRYQGR